MKQLKHIGTACLTKLIIIHNYVLAPTESVADLVRGIKNSHTHIGTDGSCHECVCYEINILYYDNN